MLRFFFLQEGLCDSKPGYVGRENENHVDLNRDFPDQFDPVKAGKFILSYPRLLITVLINPGEIRTERLFRAKATRFFLFSTQLLA